MTQIKTAIDNDLQGNLMNSTKKWFSILLLSLFFCAASFMVGKYCYIPKKDMWGGDVFILKNQSTINVWYFDTGQIREMNINDPSSEGIFNCQFYKNGVTKTIDRLTSKGRIFTSFHEDGSIKFRDIKPRDKK